MYIPDLSTERGPIGPLRDKFSVTIGTDDYTLESGFICQIAAAGDLTYRTISGKTDQTESTLAVGDVISVGDIPVVLSAIRGSSTVTSVVIGLL